MLSGWALGVFGYWVGCVWVVGGYWVGCVWVVGGTGWGGCE